MKKILVAVLLVAFTATSAFAVILGGPHDLSAKGTTAEVCKYCHTPHAGSTDAPLWSRGTKTPSGNYTAATFGSDIQGSFVSSSDTSATLCMTCHDGTSIADGTLVLTGYTWTNASANLDTLTNDHPVGFTYSGGANELVANATVNTSAVVLWGTGNDQVWCSSCHDVHDSSKGRFLRVNNAGSNLCTNCHAK
jgi:predicted CXXCH cytochrome family protein